MDTNNTDNTNIHEVPASVCAPTPAKKERMEWIDAMRGFTMIMVVAYHVVTKGFDENIKMSSSLPFLVLFRMPLFFFISGFLAYKADFAWTSHRLGMSIWKKVKIQVLPALVFLCVSLVMLVPNFGDGFIKAMQSPTKGGYWFTWSLLHMFVLYYIFSFFESKWNRRNSWVPIATLWFISLFGYATLYMPSWFTYHKDLFFDYSSLKMTMMYFHFFLFVNIVRRYWQGWQRLFDSKWFLPVVLCVVFFSCADFLKWHTLQFQWTNLPRTTAMYLLMLIVFMFFRFYKDSFTKNTRLGRFLQYIGVRTLDIYLIHFLFIPNLPQIGKFLNVSKGNIVMDILVSIVAGLVVIAFCCLVSSVIRMSPVLKRLLFGRK
jgi:fucose 4-O-acetylase-like acetyltransferase